MSSVFTARKTWSPYASDLLSTACFIVQMIVMHFFFKNMQRPCQGGCSVPDTGARNTGN